MKLSKEFSFFWLKSLENEKTLILESFDVYSLYFLSNSNSNFSSEKESTLSVNDFKSSADKYSL